MDVPVTKNNVRCHSVKIVTSEIYNSPGTKVKLTKNEYFCAIFFQVFQIFLTMNEKKEDSICISFCFEDLFIPDNKNRTSIKFFLSQLEMGLEFLEVQSCQTPKDEICSKSPERKVVNPNRKRAYAGQLYSSTSKIKSLEFQSY